MAKKYLDLSARLKKLLFTRNMKPIDLAREINISQPTIHRLITGKSTRPYKSSLKPIADFFSLSVEQLLGEDNLPNNYWNEPEAELSKNSSIKTIPIISWMETEESQVKDEHAQYIATIGNISDSCFALTMHDSSMEPLFPKHTILMFDPQRHAGDRSYVLVKLNNIAMPIFRQLLIDIDHRYLKPLNPDLNTYQMRLLSKEDHIIATLLESRINHQHTDDASNLIEEID